MDFVEKNPEDFLSGALRLIRQKQRQKAARQLKFAL